MIHGMSHFNVWVFDQDEALRFYRDALGFEVRQDVTVDDYRWLTVGPAQQPDVAIILSVLAPPAVDADAVDTLRDLVARGALSPGILATDDCRADFAALSARGVEFVEEPSERFYGIDAAFRDPFGNRFRLVQRAPVPAG